MKGKGREALSLEKEQHKVLFLSGTDIVPTLEYSMNGGYVRP